MFVTFMASQYSEIIVRVCYRQLTLAHAYVVKYRNENIAGYSSVLAGAYSVKLCV